MVTLIFTACLIAAPVDCREEHIEAPSLFACQMQGQAQIAAWITEHPKYALQGGWDCQIVFSEPGRNA